MPDALRLAVGTLTALPVAPPRAIDQGTAARAMVLAPVVALLPGGAAAGVAWAAGVAGLTPLVAAALALVTLTLGTRGMHLDGLADTADGLTASYDRVRALAVMRRGDTGPAGLAAVVLVLLVQAAAMAQAVSAHGAGSVVLAAVAARAVLPLACGRGVPSARRDGLGATVAGSVPWPAAALTLAGCAVALGAGAMLAGQAWWPAVAALAAACLAAGLVVTRAVRRLGGITGDVLGACVEVGMAAALVVLAAA